MRFLSNQPVERVKERGSGRRDKKKEKERAREQMTRVDSERIKQ